MGYSESNTFVQRLGGLILALAAATLAWAAPPEGPRFGAPDLLFFEQAVAADLNSRCASCHSDPEMATRFLLTPLDDLERPSRAILLKNFRAVVAFVDPENPGESRLLKRALGEDGHPGGPLYQRSKRAFERLQHFVMGATLRDRPPEAIVQKRYDARVGEELELDGTLSGDPDGKRLEYLWSVVERPPGSVAGVSPAEDEGATLFAPDRPGVYRIELSVYDGKLWSLPAALMVVAAGTLDRPAVPSERKATGPAPTQGKPKRALTDRRLDVGRLKAIRRLYFDLKRRTPYLHEVEAWYDRTHAEMVDAFLKDEETWSAWYENQLFYFLLLDRFRPKEGRITTIPARLTRGEITVQRALEEIVRSQYFGARNPGNDTFVTVVLEQCLGMVVQERKNRRVLEAGKKMYDGYPAKVFRTKGNSQADFVRIVFRQREFSRHLLARTWKELHGRDLEEKRLEGYTDRLVADPAAFRPLLREWLTGPDYVAGVAWARTKPEIPYVRGLFVDALGRVPSYEELRNVRNAFLSLADPTPVRLVMGRVLLESREARIPPSAVDPPRFVKEQFVRLFARPPTDRELNTFVAALKDDPLVTPGVVLWTLISSPEYQSY